jgi:hypothetical protein
MLLNADFYNLTQQTQGIVFTTAAKAYQGSSSTSIPLLQVRRGYAESPAWMMMQAAEFYPDTLSIERLRVRAIWSSERILQGVLELMTSEMWLERSGDDYRLTEKGRDILDMLLLRREEVLTAFQPFLKTNLMQMEQLLSRIITTSLQAPTPPGCWSLEYSRRRAPGSDAPVLCKIIHYFEDLNAFRDDAYMAAWIPYRVDGYIWESFALICDGTAFNASSVYEQLPHRGYNHSEFTKALHELTRRGWLSVKEDVYSASETGRRIRKEVEQLTDHYFYSPWSCLTGEELEALQVLMDGLRKEAENVPIN